MTTLTLGKVRPVYKGAWDESSTYEYYDAVTYEGSIYLAIKNKVPANHVPPEQTESWVLFGAKGDRGEKGETGTQGERGPQGEPGKDGQTPIIEPATESSSGVVRIATQEEIDAILSGKDHPQENLQVVIDIMKFCKMIQPKLPAGLIFPWGGKLEDPPDGFLLLDGSKVSAEEFPRLAASKAFAVDDDGMMTLTAPPEGYALGFTKSMEKVMTVQNGKLPNITGRFHSLLWSPFASYQILGSFSGNHSGDSFDRNGGSKVDVNKGLGYYCFDFDASKSNNIYSGNALCSPSLLLHMIVSY